MIFLVLVLVISFIFYAQYRLQNLVASIMNKTIIFSV